MLIAEALVGGALLVPRSELQRPAGAASLALLAALTAGLARVDTRTGCGCWAPGPVVGLSVYMVRNSVLLLLSTMCLVVADTPSPNDLLLATPLAGVTGLFLLELPTVIAVLRSDVSRAIR